MVNIKIITKLATKIESRFNFLKYYRGVSWAAMSVIPNFTVTMLGYELFSLMGFPGKKDSTYLSFYLKNFGVSSFVVLLASSLTYPIDTLKRLSQVSGTFRYNTDFFSNAHAFYKVRTFGYQNFYK